MIVSKGNHPQIAELFRLLNYCNLPRCLGDDVYTMILHLMYPQVDQVDGLVIGALIALHQVG